jgi:hypothetical protein
MVRLLLLKLTLTIETLLVLSIVWLAATSDLLG